MLLFQNFVEIFDQFDESLLDEQALIDVLTDGNNSAIDEYFYDLFGKSSILSSDSFLCVMITLFFLENIDNDQTLTDEIASILTTLQTTTSTTQTVLAVSSLAPSSSLATTSSATAVSTTSASQTAQGNTSTTQTVSQQVTSYTTTTAANLNNSSAISNSAERNDIIASILLILSSFLLRI